MFKPIAISVFCLATVVAAAAHASDGKQANGVGVTRDGDADPVSRRKADLRAALHARKQSAPDHGQAPQGNASPGRILSDQERANLRQQIRQQRP
jgi:uncharacterized membrane protein